MENLEHMQKKLEQILKKERFQHTLGVMYTAASLAMCHGYDIEEALTAGLLHDCAKFCSSEKQIKLCKKYGIKLTQEELQTPSLIHAKLGAFLAEQEYHIENSRILTAILYHTTGRPEMSMLEKIIYLADYIEPGRKMIPSLPQIRQLAFHDLDRAVCVCADATLTHLREQKKAIHPLTIETYQYYSRDRSKNKNLYENIERKENRDGTIRKNGMHRLSCSGGEKRGRYQNN